MDFIDAHHHTWDHRVFPYPGVNDPHPIGDISHFKENYLITDLLDDAKNQNLIKSVHVECGGGGKDNPVEETAWLQSLADAENSKGFPHGIVAYSDFLTKDVEKELEEHCSYKNMRGIRYMLNFDPDVPLNCFAPVDKVVFDTQWRANYALLEKYNLSFDMQLWWPQNNDALKLMNDFPNILNIINHAGMPRQRDKEYIDNWRNGLKILSQASNAVIKISGLAMFDQQWTLESIRPLVLDAINIFGINRCIFATNFPVDRKYSDFDKVLDSYTEITKDFSDDEKNKIFHGNATKYYRL